MGKYGCTTLGQACAYEKEEIKHALNGEILLGWDEKMNSVRPPKKQE